MMIVTGFWFGISRPRLSLSAIFGRLTRKVEPSPAVEFRRDRAADAAHERAHMGQSDALARLVLCPRRGGTGRRRGCDPWARCRDHCPRHRSTTMPLLRSPRTVIRPGRPGARYLTAFSSRLLKICSSGQPVADDLRQVLDLEFRARLRAIWCLSDGPMPSIRSCPARSFQASAPAALRATGAGWR